MEKLKIKLIDCFGTVAMAIMMYLKDIIEIIVDGVFTFIVCLLLTKFFFMPVQVSGDSMYPTLKDKQLGFSNIFSRRIDDLDRFDIVIVQDKFEDRKLVKRVIGLPNETICCSNGCIYIDGAPIEEYYLDDQYVASQLAQYNYQYFTSDFVCTLGNGEYFLLGDNRIISLDSRYYGPFTSKEILAKNIFVFYPFKNIGVAK